MGNVCRIALERRPPEAEVAGSNPAECASFPFPCSYVASTRRPLALDLFCGAGGAAMGLHRAGFDVIGIDIRAQPRYPFPFIQADALQPPVNLADFDLIWASPPCQMWSIGSARWKEYRKYVDAVQATRAMLDGHPLTVIENVPGAPIRQDLVLTGSMFGLSTYRRRHFELSFFMLAPDCGRPFGPLTRAGSFTAAGHGGHGPNRPRLWAKGMNVEWMTDKHEIAQAVPPAYAEFIGRTAITYSTANSRSSA